VAKSQTVQETRAYARLLYISENYLSIPAAIAIAVFGYATADRFNYDLGATWLLLGQILFYVIVILGLGILRPAAKELYRLTREAPDGPITPEITSQLSQALPAIAGMITSVLFVFIVYLMVAKPGW
jgi:uncharacterized membrane protein